MDSENKTVERIRMEPVDRSLFVGAVNDPDNIKRSPVMHGKPRLSLYPRIKSLKPWRPI